MTTVRIVGTATITHGVNMTKGKTIEKVWPTQDVMKLSVCRSWVTKTFNRLRKELGPNDQLRVTFNGHLDHPPHSYYMGGIRGTQKLVIHEGDMDQ